MGQFKTTPLMDIMAALSSGRDRYSLPGGRDESMLRTDYPMSALRRPLDEAGLVALMVRLQMQREMRRQTQKLRGGLYR